MIEKRHNRIRRTSLAQSLVLISVFYPFTLGSSNFQLVDEFKTYQEAKSYCRDMYTDLVTVHNLTVMNELITLATNKTPRAWIGLEIADVRVWHWSQPDQKTDFFNWKFGEPQDMDEDTCVAMDQHGQWFESECRTTRSFVCQDNDSKHILVTKTKSWRDAQSHCRNLSSELVSIHSTVENTAVLNVSASQVVWIGLFKDPWVWSDGSNSSFRFWRPNQPNYLEDQYCTVAVFRLGGQWNDLRCRGKHWFICNGERKTLPTTASTEMEKDTMSDSPNRTLTTHTRTSFEAATSATATLTPEMTELPSTTDRTTTEEETTVSEFTSSPQTKTLSTTSRSQHEQDTITTDSPSRTTQMMTSSEAATVSTPEMTELATTTDIITTEELATVSEFASSPCTELYSETTETSTVTVTQPTETLDLTTVIDSTTPFGTSVQSTTQSSNVTPTVSSPSNPDNLILIQENMTWIEAMGYCRENHIDLVNILNQELQDEVAEKAKSATTANVWMGLRYNCKFEFWFWTSSSSGCYQSWAPGHGSEWEYECGVSGAIEATGRHQWVGLPQGNQLNFICSTCPG